MPELYRQYKPYDMEMPNPPQNTSTKSEDNNILSIQPINIPIPKIFETPEQLSHKMRVVSLEPSELEEKFI